MAKRQLRVDMREIVDAIATYGDEAPRYYLDLETGELRDLPGKGHYDLCPEDYDEALEEDLESDRFAEVPTRSARDAIELMVQFVNDLGDEDEDVKDQLRVALSGRGAFQRFRQVLAPHRDLRARWELADQQALLRYALDWFAGLDVEPIYEMPPTRLPQPAPRPAEPRVASPGLVDLLLLGAPGGKTELIEGRVRRVYTASDAGGARRTFVKIARELVEHEGIAWRKRFVEGRDVLELPRHRLSLQGRTVELSVEVPRETWQAFTRGET